MYYNSCLSSKIYALTNFDKNIGMSGEYIGESKEFQCYRKVVAAQDFTLRLRLKMKVFQNVEFSE